MPAAPSIPGTGFISLSDYLKANQGTLANGFSSLNNEAQGDVAGAQGPAGQAQADAAMKSQELGHQVGSESGLAGRYGGPGGAFDASLMWAKNGPALQGLSSYLGQQQVKTAPPPPPPPQALPPDNDPNQPPGSKGWHGPPNPGGPWGGHLGGR